MLLPSNASWSKRHAVLVVLAVTPFSLGCPAASSSSSSSSSSGGSGSADAGGASVDAGVPCSPQVDWNCDVQPIIQRRCASCHAQDGVAPFPLLTYQDFMAVEASALLAVESRRMPPWPPQETNGCPPLLDSRALSDAELETIRTWAAEDYREGTAGSVPPPRPVQDAGIGFADDPPGPPDTVFTVGTGYVPRTSRSDDYHCFVVDPELSGTRHLHSYSVVPGNVRIVHHVLLYLVLPDDVARLNEWDAREPGDGFTCYGAPAPGVPLTLGGWAPGQRPQHYRKGDGAWMPPGSRIVVQMHYNFINGTGTDETRVELSYVQGQPFREIATVPFPGTGFAIPPGNPAYTYTSVLRDLPTAIFSRDLDLRLEGVAPHMHTLGTAISVTLDAPDAGSQCLINIPRWDFNWQGFYLFNTDDPLPVPLGSGFSLSCTWDNSAANQPILDGGPATPKRVTWGEGTLDEMCLAYLIISGVPGWTETVLALAKQSFGG